MARVKGGVKTRRRHKRVLAQTKGQFGARHKNFRKANEALLHALAYATRDRRNRRRDLRRLWITRINAAARLNGTTYSKLMHALQAANIRLDRKILADLAARDASAFAAVVKAASA
ncbi:MAG: 50S ribosomal protein L20 [Thermoflexales bacterium]|nr:50S ribosomal protein L20 [Thermoflexales bacterium]